MILEMVGYKGNQFYTATWINKNDKTDRRYFRFEIQTDGFAEFMQTNGMMGSGGQSEWLTTSEIPFAVGDIIIFMKQKYEITLVDGDFKKLNEQSHSGFNNCDVYKLLRLQSAGNMENE